MRREFDLMKRPDWAEMLKRGEVIIIESGKEITAGNARDSGGAIAPAKRCMTVAEKNERKNEILKILGGK